MNRLTIIGSVNPVTGYGKHLIRAAQDIEALTDTRVGIRPLKQPTADAGRFILERICTPGWSDGPPNPVEWELIIAPPTVCPTPGKRTVYFTMNETTRLTDASVALLNKAEHLIVPNQWNKEVFMLSKVNAPIHIVPLGIDHHIFNWRPLPPPSPVVFGTAGSGQRKGIPDVIRAFLEAFPSRNDVRLRIKLTTEDEAPDVVDPRIDVVRTNYTDEQMADWYASLHCFVSASRGEGWGLMHRESASMGRQVVSTFRGGLSDFRPSLYTLAYKPEIASSPYVGHWDVPNISGCEGLSFKMGFFAVARRTDMGISKHDTWDRSSDELIRVLMEVGAIKGFCSGSTESRRASDHTAVSGKLSNAIPNRVDSVTFRGTTEASRSSALPTAKYYHSGNLGDIIYGLYAMREHCGERGAELIIGPCQHGTGAGALKTPITKQQFDMLLPLLKTQKWIKRVRWSQFYPIAEDMHDMNGFRKIWPRRHVLGIKTLCEAQFEHLGIREKFDPTHAWLDSQPSWKGTNLPRVVIHRSARWRQDDQMWRKLVNAHREKLLFVGTAEEYFEFENTYGAVSFWKVRDFLELAEIITFAIGFVGNQSFPCALALAFGRFVFQEQSLATPDCTFDRPWFWTQKDDVRQVVKGWLE